MVNQWQVTPRTRRREVGDTGVNIFSGILMPQEYNTEWSVPTRYQIIDKMRADPTVAACLRALKLPLIRARHYFEPADDTPLQREIADWLSYQLFEYNKATFASFQRHAYQALEYGSYPFEKVWVVDGSEGTGKICLEKLGPRHPASIFQWIINNNGELVGVVQTLHSDIPGSHVRIPASKLLVFVNEQEGADYYGRSMLRPVYKPWWYKQGMEAVDAVAKEKRASGVDIMELEEGADEDDKNLAEAALATIRTHQHNYLTYPKARMNYRIDGIGAGSVLSTMESMEFHDLRILRAFFTEFLAMGANGGNLAQHKDKTSLMLLLDEAIGEDFLQVINRDLVPQMVDFNWPNIKEYPKLKHARLDQRDLGAIADGLFKLTQAGFLHPRGDGEDENVIRDMYELPEATPDDVMPDPTSAARQPEDVSGEDEPPEYLQKVVNRQLASLRAMAGRTRDINDVVSLSVPFKAEAASLIADNTQSSDPELAAITARTRAEIFAGQLKAQIVREWRVTNPPVHGGRS